MRIISRPILLRFLATEPGAAPAVDRWWREANRATWKDPHEVKAFMASTSIIDAERVVFNLAGNRYRLVCAIVYDKATIFIKFIGTHRQYDAIDAATIEPTGAP